MPLDPISLGLAIGGPILGGLFGGNSQKKAQRRAEQARNSALTKTINMNSGLYDEQMARQQPFMDFGNLGVSQLANGYDFRQTPEFQYRQGLGTQALAGMQGISPDVANFAQGQMNMGLGFQEQDQSYNRIMDRIKIGQGQAGSAGQAAQQYGNSLGNAYQQSAMNTANANQNVNSIGQNQLYTALGQASQVPAYLRYSNYAQNRGY